MLKLRTACETTTAHGLSRLVGDKPLFIRVGWLLLFLLFLAFFLRGLVGFVNKLQSRQVTSSLEAGSVRFQFPDVYVCFENPVSGTYAVNMNESDIQQVNASLNRVSLILENWIRSSIKNNSMGTEDQIKQAIEIQKRQYSLFYVPSLPYRLLIDSLAQRKEQSVLKSSVFKSNNLGIFAEQEVPSTAFYHSNLMRCFSWTVDTAPVLKTLDGRSSLLISLFIDDYDGVSIPSLNGNTVASPVYVSYQQPSGGALVWLNIPVTAWSLVPTNSQKQDRKSGVRVFLMSPGEYPSEFGSSFLLAPGSHHLIEVSMREEARDPSQFECVSGTDPVQFVNPYNMTPYNHTYSYSYCYFDEYNKKSLAETNYLAPDIPMTWNVRKGQNYLNLTGAGDNTLLKAISGNSSERETNLDEFALKACQSRSTCTKLVYSAQVSSSSWPTLATLRPFVGKTVAEVRDAAFQKAVPVPGLEFLVNASSGNSSMSAEAIDFARANLLKLEIRPRRMDCDRLKFSIDYGWENFIADIGGIMGIYLGMSLLTICELFDLIAEVFYLRQCSAGSFPAGRVAAKDQSGQEVTEGPERFDSTVAVFNSSDK